MSSGSLLSVVDLAVTFPTEDGDVHAVRGLSFDVTAGETVGIVGESGSGKSVTAQAVLQLVRGARVGGQAWFHGADLLVAAGGGDAAHPRRPDRHGVPGSAVEPASRSTPSAGRSSRRSAPTAPGVAGRPSERAVELLDEVGIPDPGPPSRRLPAPVLRWHAPAGDAGDGLGPAPGAADRRRADNRPRRHRPGAAARTAGEATARARHRGRARHARPRRRRPGRRPGAARCTPDGSSRKRSVIEVFSVPAPSVHAWPAELHPGRHHAAAGRCSRSRGNHRACSVCRRDARSPHDARPLEDRCREALPPVQRHQRRTSF